MRYFNRLLGQRIVLWVGLSLVLLMVPLPALAVSFTARSTGPVVNDGGDSRSVNFIDYDNDGWLDLQITNGPNPAAPDFLYHNNGDGTYTKVTGDEIVTTARSSDGAGWADLDNDGDLDCFISNWYNQTNLLFVNDGDGTFTRRTTGPVTTANTYSEAGSWCDFDQDGDLDLYVCNSGGSLRNPFYINDATGVFTQTLDPGPPATDSRISRVGVWGDYDDDGDSDLFVANEANNINRLYTNNGDGTFTTRTDPPFNQSGASFGASWGDYDNDGDLDLFVANWSGQNNFLYTNNGDGSFTAVTGDPVVTDSEWAIGSAWADVDNDGDLDLYVTNGYTPAANPNDMYMNNGDGTFTKLIGDPIVTDLGWAYGCAFGDVDRDGDLDLGVARLSGGAQNNDLYLNDGNSNHYLSVKCEGTFSNHFGIGTRIRIKATIGGVPTWQMRDITSVSGYAGQSGLEAWFGLGDATIIDSLVARWPLGIERVMENVPVDQVLTIFECSGPDSDADGIPDLCDNCPDTPNTDQADLDSNDIGDACQCVCDCHGDPQCDDVVNVLDVVKAVNVAFRSQPDITDPNGGCPTVTTDANCDSVTNVLDVVKFVNVAFRSADPLTEFCDPCTP
jgi:hypothetical protein